jgi:hypothetical protein
MGYTPPKGAKPVAGCIMTEERDMVMRGSAGVRRPRRARARAAARAVASGAPLLAACRAPVVAVGPQPMKPRPPTRHQIKEFGRQASSLDPAVIGDCWSARTTRLWRPLCGNKGGKKECEDASPVCIWKPLPAVPGVLNPARDGDCIVSGTGQMLQVLKGDDATIRSLANVCGLLSGTSPAKCQSTGGADAPINMYRLQARRRAGEGRGGRGPR